MCCVFVGTTCLRFLAISHVTSCVCLFDTDTVTVWPNCYTSYIFVTTCPRSDWLFAILRFLSPLCCRESFYLVCIVKISFFLSVSFWYLVLYWLIKVGKDHLSEDIPRHTSTHNLRPSFKHWDTDPPLFNTKTQTLSLQGNLEPLRYMVKGNKAKCLYSWSAYYLMLNRPWRKGENSETRHC